MQIFFQIVSEPSYLLNLEDQCNSDDIARTDCLGVAET